MAYNTGNPLGSSNPKDLYDNAHNLDDAVNGDEYVWTDRFGRQRKSWAGIVEDFEGPAQQAAQDAQRAEDAADRAEDSENQSETARDQAVAAAEASGDIKFFNTYADAAVATLEDGDVVEVFADETANDMPVRYRYEDGSLVRKHILPQGTVINVPTISALKEQSVFPSRTLFAVLDTNKGGLFQYISGDLSSEISIDSQEGVYVALSSDPSGESGAFRRVFDISKGLDVAWFGAVGDYDQSSDSGTDNYTAIQSAFDFAWKSGINKVAIGPGDYVLRTRAYLRPNLSVICDSQTTLYRGHNFTLFGTVDGSYPETQQLAYDGVSHVTWSGGKLHLNSVNYPDAANGIAMAHGREYKFSDLTIKDVYATHAMDINGIDGLYLTRVRFEGWFEDTGSGSGHFPGTIREAMQVTYGSSDWTPTKNVFVEDCWFGGSDTPGSQPWPTGIGNHGWHTPEFVSNINIRNSTFVGCIYAGVKPYSWDGVRVQGCTFESCRIGVLLENAVMDSADTIDADGVQQYQAESNRNVWIVDNIFRDCTVKAIQGIASVGSESVMEGYAIPWQRNIHIRGNRAFNTQGTTGGVIDIQWCVGLWVTDNYIDRGFRGMYLGFLKNSFIRDNRVYDTDREGIYILEPSSGESGDWSWVVGTGLSILNKVRGNTLDFIGYHGIRLINLVRSTVTENDVYAASNSEDATYDGIRVEQISDRIYLDNNTVNHPTSGNGARYGFYIGNGPTNIRLGDNSFAGKTGARSIYDISQTLGGYAILREFVDDVEAAAGDVAIDGMYRTGNTVKVRVN